MSWKVNFLKRNSEDGLTVVEIILIVAVIVLLLSIVITPLVRYREHQVLIQESGQIKSMLNKARSLTLSSKNGSRYGIHFSSDQLVLFENTYNPANTANIFYNLDKYVSLTEISLSGGSSEVLFAKISGEASNYGFVRAALKSDPSKNKAVNVKSTGVID